MGLTPVPGAETLIVAEPVLAPQLIPGPQPLGPQPVHRPEPIVPSPVEKRRRGRPPKAREICPPSWDHFLSRGWQLESRTQPLPPATTPAATPVTLPGAAVLSRCCGRQHCHHSHHFNVPTQGSGAGLPRIHHHLGPASSCLGDREGSSVLESCGIGEAAANPGPGESEGSSHLMRMEAAPHLRLARFTS